MGNKRIPVYFSSYLMYFRFILKTEAVMARNTEHLDEIETVTLSHYNQNAEAYWNGTKDHDVAQNHAAFLAPFPKDKKLDILDLGCGPGRDVRYFKSLGHRPVGLDGSEVFCAMARSYTGCPILHQKFLSLELPAQAFDGVFANASLFHIPSQELPGVLNDLHAALKPGGILFISNPRGNGETCPMTHEPKRGGVFPS
ncbi:MAG: class I SAM-dependent methyltransferase [Methylococcales bacterium]|nr:class I SAM-dependent methyltransferase [Methylococcales bacterium]